MAFWGLLSVLVLLHNTGGLLGAQVRSYIVDGKDAKPNSWKSMAYMKFLEGNGKDWGCGATIISEWWVMSAASCWKRKPDIGLKNIVLIVGLVDLENDAEDFIGIDRNPVIQSNVDLALFHTKRAIPMNDKVGVMSLATKNNFGPSPQCWIIGCGDVRKGVPLAKPRKLQQREISLKACKDKGSNMLCAEDYACDGDYGGPLVCKQGNSIVQVGIMSTGNCNPNGQPGVYTPVYEYYSWIKQNIESGENI
ncbi:tryptase-like [Spinachia spinachia]